MNWTQGILGPAFWFALLSLAGCATIRPPLSLPFDRTAKTVTGTVQWRQDPKAKPFHGDVVIRYQKPLMQGKELLAMTVSKGPGMTFLEMQIRGDDTEDHLQHWQMTLLPYHRTLSGHGTTAPGPLAIWLQMRGCSLLLAHPGTLRSQPETRMPSPDSPLYQFSLSEFETIHQQRLPTRIQITEPKTGASLEFKLGEVH